MKLSELSSFLPLRKLSRKDWLDALKNHAEHRQWIQEFTTEQLGIANKQLGQECNWQIQKVLFDSKN